MEIIKQIAEKRQNWSEKCLKYAEIDELSKNNLKGARQAEMYRKMLLKNWIIRKKNKKLKWAVKVLNSTKSLKDEERAPFVFKEENMADKVQCYKNKKLYK